MVTQRLSATAGIPDIPVLLGKPGSIPLGSEDFACLLRCYLREILSERGFAQFMMICEAGYLMEQITALLPQRINLRPPVKPGVGIALELPALRKNGEPLPIALLVVQHLDRAAIAALELATTTSARLRYLDEREYFERMQDWGVMPSAALNLVHEALHRAAIVNTPDRVEPLTTRLEEIGSQIACILRKKGLPW